MSTEYQDYCNANYGPADIDHMRPLNDREIREIIARDELIQRHQPKCPACETDQVQIKFKDAPARWKCRRCKHWFTSEPSAMLPQE